MKAQIRPALVMFALFTVLTGVLYPVVVTAVAQAVMPWQANGSLVVAVSDDGVGGADPTAGSGLGGLEDRVAALGGTLRVRSPVGEGTRITAEIPVDG